MSTIPDQTKACIAPSSPAAPGWRGAPSVVALLVAFGIVAVAVAARLDGPSDATVVMGARWDAGSSWLVVDVPDGPDGLGSATQLRSGDEVTAVDGQEFA